MAYTKQSWSDGSAGNTPLSAARLGTIEQGIFDAHSAAAAALNRANHTGQQLASTISDLNPTINAMIAQVVGAAPASLDTLRELATALGNDANFAATMTNALAGKMPIPNGTDQDYIDGTGSVIPLASMPDFPPHGHSAADITTGKLNIERAASGAVFDVIQAEASFGSTVGSWPAARPSTRTDIKFECWGATPPPWMIDFDRYHVASAT